MLRLPADEHPVVQAAGERGPAPGLALDLHPSAGPLAYRLNLGTPSQPDEEVAQQIDEGGTPTTASSS
jgi:hypothetical protein